MLILSRKPGQSIIINGGEIKIVVVGRDGNQVKIGIDAPRSMPVVREELFNRQEDPAGGKGGN